MLAASWDVVGDVVLVTGLVLSCASLVPRFLRRKHPRCPTCSYDLTGVALTPVPKCPECGKQARSTRRLFRGRVHRRLLAGGVVLSLLCNVPYSVPRVEEAGWVGAVPTTVLAAAIPCFSPTEESCMITPRGPFEYEYVRRVTSALESGELEPGILLSGIIRLRVELPFRWAGRWGGSDEERAALARFKEDLPHPDPGRETLADFVRAVEAATGRTCRIDREGFDRAGFDSTRLRLVEWNSPTRDDGLAFPVQSEDGESERVCWAWPTCVRGEVVLTPRPLTFQYATILKPIPGTTVRETADFITTCDTPFSMYRTMGGFGRAPIMVVLANCLLIYGTEPAVSYIEYLHTLACQPSPTPWGPSWLSERRAPRHILDSLEATQIPANPSEVSVSEAISVLTAATGLRVFDYSHRYGSKPSDELTLPNLPAGSAANLLDFIAARLGENAAWDLSPDGAVEFVSDRLDFDRVEPSGLIAIYDAPQLIRDANPSGTWYGLLTQIPGNRDNLHMAILGSKLMLRTTLVNHYRFERYLRQKLESLGVP